MLVRRTYRDDTSLSSVFSIIRKFSRGRSKSFVSIQADEEGDNLLKPNEDAAHVRESVSPSGQLLLEDELGQSQLLGRIPSSEERLGLVEVAKLSMEFAVLWVSALKYVMSRQLLTYRLVPGKFCQGMSLARQLMGCASNRPTILWQHVSSILPLRVQRSLLQPAVCLCELNSVQQD